MAQAVEFLLLAVLLGTCLAVTYSDLRYGKVPNRVTFSAIAVGLAGRLILCGLGDIDLRYFLLSLAAAPAIGFGLYWVELWGAGDAKLFMAGALCIPPSLAGPPFAGEGRILIFAFALAFIYLLVRAAPRVARAGTRLLVTLKPQGTPRAIAAGVALRAYRILAAIGFGFLARLLLGVSLGIVQTLVIFPVVFLLLSEQASGRAQYWIYLPFALLALYQGALRPGPFLTAVCLVIPLMLVAVTGARVVGQVFTMGVPLGRVRPGMILLDAPFHRPDGSWDLAERKSRAAGEPLLDPDRFILRAADVERIQGLVAEGHLDPQARVRAQQTFAFAPLLCLGILLHLGMQIYWTLAL